MAERLSQEQAAQWDERRKRIEKGKLLWQMDTNSQEFSDIVRVVAGKTEKLRKETGRLSYPLFIASVRMPGVYPCIEVIVKDSQGKLYLRKREVAENASTAEQAAWGERLHLSGTTVFPAKPLETNFEGLLDREVVRAASDDITEKVTRAQQLDSLYQQSTVVGAALYPEPERKTNAFTVFVQVEISDPNLLCDGYGEVTEDNLSSVIEQHRPTVERLLTNPNGPMLFDTRPQFVKPAQPAAQKVMYSSLEVGMAMDGDEERRILVPSEGLVSDQELPLREKQESDSIRLAEIRGEITFRTARPLIRAGITSLDVVCRDWNAETLLALKGFSWANLQDLQQHLLATGRAISGFDRAMERCQPSKIGQRPLLVGKPQYELEHICDMQPEVLLKLSVKKLGELVKARRQARYACLRLQAPSSWQDPQGYKSWKLQTVGDVVEMWQSKPERLKSITKMSDESFAVLGMIFDELGLLKPARSHD